MPERPSLSGILLRQIRHEITGFLRNPMAAFFTLIFPLLFLLLVASLAGNETIDARQGVRVAQFITPAVGAFAAATAAYTSQAIGVAIKRDQVVLKRVRGTPIPPAAYLGAQIGASVIVGLVAVALMVVVGVFGFDVQLIGRTMPATVVTLLVGIGCFSALGMMVVALSPNSATVQAVTNATLVPLAFISDVFVIGGELPSVLNRIGWFFPLKHFANALGDAFNPFLPGAGWSWDHLAVMAAWGVAAGAVAVWRFRWEPVGSSGGASTRAASPAATGELAAAAPGPPGPVAARGGARVATRAAAPAVEEGRPSLLVLIVAQVRAGVRAYFRDRSSAFFALVFPLILLGLFSTIFGDPTLDERGGIALVQFLTPALAVFAMANIAYGNLAEWLAEKREAGVLKRVRGTPLPPSAYLAGRIGTTVVVSLLSMAVTILFGVLAFEVEIVPRMLGGALVSAVLGIACFTALGLCLAALAPSVKAVPAIAQATLLPLAFVSDVFLIGELPAWMRAIGDAFPLRHAVIAVADGFNPTISGAGFSWDRLAVLALWLVAASLLALRRFRWEPNAG